MPINSPGSYGKPGLFDLESLMRAMSSQGAGLAPQGLNIPQGSGQSINAQDAGKINQAMMQVGAALAQQQGLNPDLQAISQGLSMIKKSQDEAEALQMRKEEHEAKISESKYRQAAAQTALFETAQKGEREAGFREAMLGRPQTDFDQRSGGALDAINMPAGQRQAIEAALAYDPKSALSMLGTAVKPRTFQASDLVQVQGPNGPMYVPAEAAIGESPFTKPDQQLEQVYDPNSPTGTRMVPRAQAAGQPGKPGFGATVKQTPGGGLEVSFGPGQGGGMTKKTASEIEEQILASNESLARLETIQSQFKPEYQEIPTQLGAAWTGLKAKFGDRDIPAGEKKLLTDFSAYRRNTVSNLNKHIKDATGASMAVTEVPRLTAEVPNAGTGLFDGDDPITFKSKLDSTMKEIRKANVRYRHYRENGITDVEVMARRSPLETIPVAINPETGDRIYQINGQWIRG